METVILIIITAVTAFLLALLTGPIAIPFLKKIKFGQSIREDGPTWHQGKSGTPTMGGFIFILGTLVATVIALVNVKAFTSALIPLLTALGFGFVGFVDDYIKVVKKRNLGLKKMPKFLMQGAFALTLVISLDIAGYIDTALYIPFINITWELGVFYHVLAVVAVIAIVNAVNFTDGIDGLATSVAIPCLITLVALGFMIGLDGAVMFGVALTASLVAFLIFNFNPAKVFMGDTGSLFIGGAIAALCVTYNMLLVFFFVGIVFCIEMLSVVLQIGYFRLTHGKRLFKMAPIHHHFELCGWNEVKIVFVAAAVTIFFSALGFFGFSEFLIV